MSDTSPNVLERLAEQARAQGLHMHVRYPDDPPLVFKASMDDLARESERQRRLAPSGPTVTVRIEHSEEWREVEVLDGEQ